MERSRWETLLKMPLTSHVYEASTQVNQRFTVYDNYAAFGDTQFSSQFLFRHFWQSTWI